MQYGFLLDHRKCIGCHACTVACKAENDVPVGSFRTWVKYTEAGLFPAVRRHFTVLRCNHCSSAPCVTICPVKALEKRPDGIVDIDREACIGCRACMQACPYDALYLNEDLGAVEKCHYCAHRIERGLEPACVVVCPTGAIVPGDVHDPASRISGMLRDLRTEVRRPEQRTGPNVHYAGHLPSALRPGSAERPASYLWSEVPPTRPEAWPAELPLEPETRTVLDAGHKVEWGTTVALYLVTKGMAAGAALLAPFLALLGAPGLAAGVIPEVIALTFTLITTALLAADLARPRLFLRVLTRPNWSSWLVRGAVILMLFGGASFAALALRLIGMTALADAARWAGAVLALPAAGYTAFLFAQCEGRDLWQSRALLPHLVVQAILCGAAMFLPFAPAARPLLALFAAAALGHVAFSLWERLGSHPTDNARQGAAFLPVVRWMRLRPFRDGLLACAVATLAVLVVSAAPLLLPAAIALLALAGLLLYEWAFVRAGQLPPLS